ncbi:hypothetical protein B6V73_05640 [Thioclava sp. JM3]|uniref:hypothetical protein n=1 Tax=Thioclava sp. JM3 TaxID=1973004 RepID=UPI000B5417F8|nr:hypothetical protein [Thioclava sp. JM3]OWY18090.1 hypothetical protein B6V73_05640 [Thioclava sp. JM3]
MTPNGLEEVAVVIRLGAPTNPFRICSKLHRNRRAQTPSNPSDAAFKTVGLHDARSVMALRTRRDRPTASICQGAIAAVQLHQAGHSSMAQHFRRMKVANADASAQTLQAATFEQFLINRARVTSTRFRMSNASQIDALPD